MSDEINPDDISEQEPTEEASQDKQTETPEASRKQTASLANMAMPFAGSLTVRLDLL